MVLSIRSFGFQIWLERRSSRFPVCILKQNSAQASTLGEYFLASGPWIHQPMMHDVTKLKKRPHLESLAARQSFFQAVDRLPRPGEVACIFSSLSSLILLDHSWKRFGLHKSSPSASSKRAHSWALVFYLFGWDITVIFLGSKTSGQKILTRPDPSDPRFWPDPSASLA